MIEGLQLCGVLKWKHSTLRSIVPLTICAFDNVSWNTVIDCKRQQQQQQKYKKSPLQEADMESLSELTI